jgi:hypothetical protein
LIRHDFPPGFRLLCFNCNCVRGQRGYCPHEDLTPEEKQQRLAIAVAARSKAVADGRRRKRQAREQIQ